MAFLEDMDLIMDQLYQADKCHALEASEDTRSKAVIAPRQLAGYHNQLNSKSRKKHQDQGTIKQTRRSARLRKSTEQIQSPKTTTRLTVGPNTNKTNKIIDMAKEKDDLLRHDK